MVRVEIHETIERPIEAVFEQLIDIDRYPEWMSRDGIFRNCKKTSSGPVEVGTTYIDKTKLGVAQGEITELERPNRVEFHYTAKILGVTVMEGWPGYTLTREGDRQTTVHHVAKGRLHGAMKLLKPWIQRVADKERRETVLALKASMEE